ncbi:P-loop containing nucleoside triphosphate hydrolases superfamily protein isoform 2 [Hibiscus syriacus]|uniref:P-loop containing nucleoside triphosphate hydrolases superfamily protein isoform 2 n=1 Tax=Hibiscus syriacus TaxID=106335 RepID=A0A6A2YDN7_HIBSY|nr:P-loop containing nucleoside triphosphate hydrolases superfamily protein isoform 2 [Hibiscus syriacus]
MADESSLSRWSFLFGWRRLTEPQDDQAADATVSNVTVTSNGNHSAKNSSDMAIYEQYQKQNTNQVLSNGVVSNGFDSRLNACLRGEFEQITSIFTGDRNEVLAIELEREATSVLYNVIKLIRFQSNYSQQCMGYVLYGSSLTMEGYSPFWPPGDGKDNASKGCCNRMQDDIFQYFSIICSQQMAWHHAPSTIFLDEIDAIISQRGGEGNSEHEASRRLKTELLIQMDGLTRSDELVFVLAATNLPWELDAAMLRRLEKQPEARMFETPLPGDNGEEGLPYDTLVERSDGYPGSDIRLVCKEAAMQPLRCLMRDLENSSEAVSDHELPKDGSITPDDIEAALKNTRPSARLYVHRYEKFNADYGSQILE